MMVTHRKVKRKHGEYWELVDVKKVNGKTVQRYVEYLEKDLKSRLRSHMRTYFHM